MLRLADATISQKVVTGITEDIKVNIIIFSYIISTIILTVFV